MVVEGIDKNRHESLAGCDHLFVAQRTAGEGLATRSARVLTEMNPKGLVLLLSDFQGLGIIFLPNDFTDSHGRIAPARNDHQDQEDKNFALHAENLET